MENVQVVWFKRDLRTLDHAPLTRAAEAGPVLALYCIEPSVLQSHDFDAMHWEFIADSLHHLDERLRKHGLALTVRHGEAVEVLDALSQELEIAHLWSHMETGLEVTFARDRGVKAWTAKRDIPWTEIPQQAVVRGRLDRDDWQRHWKAFMDIRCLPAPTRFAPALPVPATSLNLPSPAELGLTHLTPAISERSEPQPAGESFGFATLGSFFEKRGRAYNKELSSPRSAPVACSRLSPHLAWGNLSIRQVLHATEQCMQNETYHGNKRAMNAFRSRLHWHCHFIQKLESEPGIEFHAFNPACDRLREPHDDLAEERLQRWMRAQTGYPFVDACMRALQSWGWINFRMRAMLVSFAAYHLWIDWRRFHPFLARQFRDYEPGIHIPQLQMQSGVTGINTLRIYNPIKQGKDHDPDGAFIRYWLPELAEVEGDWTHMPWAAPGGKPASYPDPIVDHLTAVRAARCAFSALRKQEDYWEESKRVLREHGSRNQPRRPRPARKKAATQLDLFEG